MAAAVTKSRPALHPASSCALTLAGLSGSEPSQTPRPSATAGTSGLNPSAGGGGTAGRVESRRRPMRRMDCILLFADAGDGGLSQIEIDRCKVHARWLANLVCAFVNRKSYPCAVPGCNGSTAPHSKCRSLHRHGTIIYNIMHIICPGGPFEFHIRTTCTYTINAPDMRSTIPCMVVRKVTHPAAPPPRSSVGALRHQH